MAQREIAVEVSIPSDDAIDPKAFRKLMQRAEQGDTKALAEVRTRFDAVPAAWDELGNLAVQTQRQWIRLTTGGNALMDEALRKASDHLRTELLGPQPSPFERLLVERVVACHLQVHFADQQAAAFEKAGGRFVQGEYWQKQQERAQRRYLAAMRTLAQVRRLLVPAVQVNIAENQVNVAGLA